MSEGTTHSAGEVVRKNRRQGLERETAKALGLTAIHLLRFSSAATSPRKNQTIGFAARASRMGGWSKEPEGGREGMGAGREGGREEMGAAT